MLEIFQYDFMIRAFTAGIIIGVVAPLIGMFLVVRRYSLMADTLSHVSLIGVAAGVIAHGNPVAGAIIASILAAVSMELLRESRKIMGESVLALFLSGSLAIAIILMGISRSANVNFFSYLFGSITTVSPADIWIMAICGTGVVLALFLMYRRLFLICYDEELARANGLPVKAYNIAMNVLAAVTVSISIRIVGVLLIGALMVIPVLTAIQFGKGFAKTHILSVFLSVLSCILGLYASYYLDIASGGAIVVTALIIFLASVLANSSRR